jgi:phosphoribosylamine--glycine ligase
MAWKLAEEPNIDRVYVSPGNGGTGLEEKCENVPLPGDLREEKTQEALMEIARNIHAGITVIGPEAPLEAGLVDRFRDNGLPIIGPNRAASRLETSKSYAKSFMEKYGVRTSRSRFFTGYEAALGYAENYFKDTLGIPTGIRSEGSPPGGGDPAGVTSAGAPLVIKADGLAAGKGVVIALTIEEAEASLRSFMKEGRLGKAGKTVVMEEFVEGREVSVLAAVSVSPKRAPFMLPFISARDHKRRFDGGSGPNTGGMGAIAPAPDFFGAAQQDFAARILAPTLRGMEQEGMDYRGFIFFGLMIRENHCYLLEYNARLGDPETQAVLPLMDSNFSDLCLAILENRLDRFPLMWKKGAVCAPVAVAGEIPGFPGYPGPYRNGNPIRVDRERLIHAGARLFAAGTAYAGKGEEMLTAGGRVLAVSAWGADGEEARRRAYEGLAAVSFEGMAFRTDIGRG